MDEQENNISDTLEDLFRNNLKRRNIIILKSIDKRRQMWYNVFVRRNIIILKSIDKRRQMWYEDRDYNASLNLRDCQIYKIA